MQVQSFKIQSQAEAKAFLADLLAKPECRSQMEIERQCDRLVDDQSIRDFFLAEGARMLAEVGN